jgi:hypothetical protein
MKPWVVIFLLICWLGWRLALPIDLIRTDVGRHIKNGELLLQGQWDVLYKNYYSYTYPQYPFVNHHWLFGVFCYVLWHAFGFIGLSFIYAALELLGFYLFFRCWQRFSSLPMLCASALLSFPFLSMRSDIRPEGFSVLFCGIFLYVIELYRQDRLKPLTLVLTLVLTQMIWVNMHIFFIMGPILIALFGWQARINGQTQQADLMQKVFWLLLAACLVNPSGIHGLLAPFHTDKAYSIMITENMPVFYYLKLRMMHDKSFYLYFLVSIGMLIAPLFFLIQREGLQKYLLSGALALFLSIAGLTAVRMIGPYGFFWIPLSSYLYSQWMSSWSIKTRKNAEILLLVMGILVSVSVNCDWKQRHGLGVVPGINEPAEFFKRENIPGPIFNNYNIGGYLIFHLSPRHKLFVDDRMEAFPAGFFSGTYIPMQVDAKVWQQMEQKYHFNTIFYNPESSTWGSKFLLDRYADPSWVVVFLSKEAVIFVKRNQQNQELIQRFGKHVNII